MEAGRRARVRLNSLIIPFLRKATARRLQAPSLLTLWPGRFPVAAPKIPYNNEFQPAGFIPAAQKGTLAYPMPLLSIEFAIFFVAFFALYWSLRQSPRAQNLALLAAGLGWLVHLDPWFAASVTGFAAGVLLVSCGISRSEGRPRKAWLAAGLALALLYLCFCKYFDFFRPALQEALGTGVIDVIMPLGISYYTFQGIAYLVSVFRRDHGPLPAPELLLHFSFFGTVTSGPIIRSAPFKTRQGMTVGAEAQLRARTPRSVIAPALALSLIALGVLKKWWLAGVLGDLVVNPVFENPMQFDAASVAAAMYGYTAQLFFDFSGYSDIAVGIGMLLGFSIPVNFMAPLRAYDLRDFWDRWHITLSTWIRDYIYIPLGGSRRGFARTQANLLASMVLSGLWHGYGLTFGLWGAIHGLGLVFLNVKDRLCGTTKEFRRSFEANHPARAYLGRIVTLHFVVLTFVIFRADTLPDAASVFGALASAEAWAKPAEPAAALALAAMALAWLLYPALIAGFRAFVALLEKIPAWLWPVPLAAALLAAYLWAPSGVPGFLYANF